MTTSAVTTASVTERKKHDGDVQERQPQRDNSSDPESEAVSQEPYKTEIVWRNVFLFLFLHIGAACGLYCALFTAKWQTNLMAFIGLGISGVGSSVAAHRLWCHRTFKAKLPLRIVLMMANCFALQNDIYEWTRDHRVHHKYSDTDADPHNINRGFFFAHMGWLMCKKHPEVFRKGATVDCSDVLADPVVAFQRKFYVPLVTFFCFILPTWVPMWLVGETFWNAHLVNAMLRYTVSLHMTWLVNSAAHTWGYRPYDKDIHPTENPAISFGLFGEGFHNFHHTFPQDYKSSEFGPLLNPATIFIDLMAKIGQAYDLKTTPKHLIEKRIERTGDKKQHIMRAFVST
ncbi:acyl-CoA Delta-9 desaturase-like isoform X1 [Amblyomma americanum]|uniref:Fatty acid desaturase n=1 Tax=Amblyomma americanum TaxID=6943 RepID=A0AAQ4E1X6_AMBAM